MKNFFETLLDYLPAIAILLVLAMFIGALVLSAIAECSKTEVECYTTECEVTQVVYAEKANGRSSSKAVYKLGVRGEEICTTINITAEQFAMFAVGDTVEVKVIVYEKMDGTREIKYEVLGFGG